MTALERAKEMLTVADRGTHFSAPEVLGVLRQLVDEYEHDIARHKNIIPFPKVPK